MVLTDHSPRLTVARGLSPDRLRAQLDLVAELNTRMAPFRVLTGIEVDINLDGTLDQEPELLASLDFVVASVHSKLRMPAREMTARMLTAVTNAQVNVLGHCTGRLVTGKGRPESEFDAESRSSTRRRCSKPAGTTTSPSKSIPGRSASTHLVGY
jgi:putative hydrolase